MESNVVPLRAVNTDWYQWGLNIHHLELDPKTKHMFNKEVAISLAVIGKRYYKGSQSDLDLFWEGYYANKIKENNNVTIDK